MLQALELSHQKSSDTSGYLVVAENGYTNMNDNQYQRGYVLAHTSVIYSLDSTTETEKKSMKMI